MVDIETGAVVIPVIGRHPSVLRARVINQGL